MKNRYKKIVFEDENGIIFELAAPKGMNSEALFLFYCIIKKIDLNLKIINL